MKLMKILLITITGLTLLLSGCKTSTIKVDIKSEMDSVSYALGINIAASLQQGDFNDINVIAVAKGIQEAYGDRDDIMTNEEAMAYINNYFNKERDKISLKNLEEGENFLAENATKEGVIVHESGLQYRVLVEGDGPSPNAEDMIKVHYHGTKLDGSVFDSSVEKGEPVQFQLNRVIQGWTIGVQKMKVGSKHILYIPANLAYGANPRPGAIKPNEVLIFEVELLDIIGK